MPALLLLPLLAALLLAPPPGTERCLPTWANYGLPTAGTLGGLAFTPGLEMLLGVL